MPGRKLENTLSIRQFKVAKEQATSALWRFLWNIAPYNPESRTRHFTTEFRKLRRSGEGLIWFAPNPARLDVQFCDAFFSILDKMVRKEHLSERSLQALADALNRPLKKFVCFPGPAELQIESGIEIDARLRRFLVEDSGPYRPSSQDGIRAAAQCLWEYLNLSYKCGPVHTICSIETCGALMTIGRGGKKFCSRDCRQSYWSYGRQRQYFVDAQQRNRDVRDRRKPHKHSRSRK